MMVSVSFIVTSTVTMTLNTLPFFQQHSHDENSSTNSVLPIHTTSPAASVTHTTATYDADASDNPVMAAIETVCVAWFTFEFLIRCANIRAFINECESNSSLRSSNI